MHSLPKITAATASEICARFQAPREALAVLREGMTPREFVQALLEGKLYVAGIEFLAHALPPREGIWWGCLCLQHAYGDALSPADRSAAVAAVQWVLRPGEEARSSARQPSDAAGPASAAGALAGAAFLTPANGLPPSAPAAPEPFAFSKAVAKAVKLSSIRCPPVQIPDTQRAMLELGIGVAEGRYI
jgi:hypothetical protein